MSTDINHFQDGAKINSETVKNSALKSAAVEDEQDRSALKVDINNIEQVPYFMPLFEGWQAEFIEFPLGFAPDLGYEGHADVRFMPGMFSGGAPDYWSYTFLWWLNDDVDFDAARLSSDIETYFTGLANVVDADGALQPDQAQSHQAEAQFAALTEGNQQSFIGQAAVFDGFVKHDKIRLNIQVNEVPCPAYGKKAVLFALSPQELNAEPWQDLEKVREAFTCSNP